MKVELTVWDAAFIRLICFQAPRRHEEYKQSRKLARQIERQGREAFEKAEAHLRPGGGFRFNDDSSVELSLELTKEELQLVDSLARRVVWDPRIMAAEFIDRSYAFIEERLAEWIEEADAEDMLSKLTSKQRTALRKKARATKEET